MDSVPSSTDSPVTDTVTKILNNDYVFAVLAIIAFAYGQRAGPKLPKWVIDFFSHDIVRVLFLSLLLVVRFESRPTVAIIIALVFVYILQYIYVDSANEHFDSLMNEAREKHKDAIDLKKLRDKAYKRGLDVKDSLNKSQKDALARLAKLKREAQDMKISTK